MDVQNITLIKDTKMCSSHISNMYTNIPMQKVRNIMQTKVLLATCCMLVSYLAYSVTLKMEVKYSSETSVDFQRTTQHYISEISTLNIICCLVVI
jgi:hypothetical protein